MAKNVAAKFPLDIELQNILSAAAGHYYHVIATAQTAGRCSVTPGHYQLLMARHGEARQPPVPASFLQKVVASRTIMANTVAIPLKVAVVGPPMGGKSSLLLALTTGAICDEYTPTTFDNYAVEMEESGKKYDLRFVSF